MDVDFTRFCPTLSGYGHVGSFLTALLNFLWGNPKGIILRYEDMTALHCVAHSTPISMLGFAQDFREQFLRHGIQIHREEWQSDYKDDLAVLNQERFNGELTWDVLEWRRHFRYFGEAIPSNFAGESPLMAQLSRVYCDHKDEIRLIIRGTDLAAEKDSYWLLWQLAFPETPREERPFLWFIPEVMQPDGQKVSKSNAAYAVNYALRDIDANPLRMIAGLIRNQLCDTPASGGLGHYISGNLEETIAMLRNYVRLAQFNPRPAPITAETIASWRNSHAF